jgi:hypothetical protein
MYHVGPTGGEQFYLHTLLTVVKGPTSFDDLWTFNDITYPSFHKACLAHELLENDGEWRQCLEEAATMQTGRQLWQLFATILLFCSPTEPATLWNNFHAHICDDLHHQLMVVTQQDNPTDIEVYNFGLYLLNKVLKKSGLSVNSHIA